MERTTQDTEYTKGPMNPYEIVGEHQTQPMQNAVQVITREKKWT